MMGAVIPRTTDNTSNLLSFRILKVVFFVFFALTVLSLCFSDIVDYAGKKSLGIANIIAILSAVVIFALITFICVRFKNSGFNIKPKAANVLVLVVSTVVLIFHVYSAYQIRFLGDWDAGTVYACAWNLANYWQGFFDVQGNWEVYSKETIEDYLSRYPNNRFLFSVLACFFRFLQTLGINSIGVSVLLSTIITSLFLVLAGIMVYDILRRRCNVLIALIGFLFSFIIVGLSPWFLVPYSDSFGIIVPITIFWIASFLDDLNENKRNFAWFLMVLLSVIGYYIKPQTIFSAVAVFLYYAAPRIIRLLKSRKFKKCAVKSGVVLIALFCSLGIKSAVVESATRNLQFNDEKSFTAVHFLMMGLNDETDGAFYGEDYVFSLSIEGKNERASADLDRVVNRLTEYGPVNLAEHCVKKTLANWSDSTFSWDYEDRFFDHIIKLEPCYFSQYIKDGIQPKDVAANGLIQIVWFVVVMSFLITGCVRINNRLLAAILLSILFLGVFELFFEARARYLFAYAPVMIIACCILINLFSEKINSFFAGGITGIFLEKGV